MASTVMLLQSVVFFITWGKVHAECARTNALMCVCVCVMWRRYCEDVCGWVTVDAKTDTLFGDSTIQLCKATIPIAERSRLTRATMSPYTRSRREKQVSTNTSTVASEVSLPTQLPLQATALILMVNA